MPPSTGITKIVFVPLKDVPFSNYMQIKGGGWVQYCYKEEFF